MQESFLGGLLRDNRWFFTGFGLFLLVGGILLLFIEQGDAILYFSERRSVFGNAFFRYSTLLGEENTFFAAFALLLFIRYRYALALPLIGLTVSIISYVLKRAFYHPRPIRFFTEQGIVEQIITVEGVTLNSGYSSFPSGHTMAAFTLMAFLAFCLPKKSLVGIVLVLIAVIVGLSRVYLVQHFFQDIYLGAIIGVTLAILWYYLVQHFPKVPHRWMDGRINLKKGKKWKE